MAGKKEYTNGEVTVVWQSELCVHSAKCALGLPKVFKPKDRPWIQMGDVESEKICRVVDKCPSGAISWYRNEDGPPAAE